jgi:hypothetical protein
MTQPLNPAVRDLLAAIHDALDAAEHPTRPVFAVQSVIESAVRYGQDDWSPAGWLYEQTAEAADRRRVQAADTHGLLTDGLVPVRPMSVWAAQP